MVEASPTGGRKGRWPLGLVSVVALGNLATIAVFAHSVTRAGGFALLGISVGCVVVVFVYARRLRADAAPARPHTLLLVGGPCDGRLVLSAGDSVPTELWLAGSDGSLCCYHLLTVRTAGSHTMLFQRTDVSRRSPGL